MAITAERDNEVLIVNVEGRLDGTNAQEFQSDLTSTISDQDRAVLLDFQQLSYISSAGLRAILITAKALERRNAKIAVCSLSPSLLEVFQVSGFDRIIPVWGSQTEAKANFSR